MLLEGLLRAPETAQVLDISRARLYALSRAGIIPCVRIGRSFRYSPSALRRFVETGGAGWPVGGQRIPAAGVGAPAGLRIPPLTRESE